MHGTRKVTHRIPIANHETIKAMAKKYSTPEKEVSYSDIMNMLLNEGMKAITQRPVNEPADLASGE